MLSFLLITISNYAQEIKIWTGANTIKNFSAASKKDPAYVKMMAEINSLSKSATKTNTNEAAVRTVLASNSALLSRLYKQSNIAASKPTTVIVPKKTNVPTDFPKNDVMNKLAEKASGNLERIPPYSSNWHWTTEGNPNQVYPDTTGTKFLTAKSVFTFTSGPGMKLGPYFHGQQASFRVPSDPQIMAMVLRFDYSYMYTGWDTYGAILGMDLVIEANEKYAGPFNLGIPYDYPLSTSHRWKLASHIFPADTVTSDVQSFNRNGDKVFKVVGFVTPGTTIDVKFGVGFRKSAQLGANGSYHYVEFILKKITAEYYTSWPGGNNQ